MRCAAPVAGVRLRGAVRLVLAAVAVLPAPPQLGVEPLDGLGVEPADLQGADRGADVLFDLADVALPGRGLQLDDVQVPVQRLVDRGAGASGKRA